MRGVVVLKYKKNGDNDGSDNCDYNFGTFDDFGVKSDQKVSLNMILMSRYKGQSNGGKRAIWSSLLSGSNYTWQPKGKFLFFFSFVSNGILMIFRWLKVHVISSWRWSGDEGLSWVSKTDPDSLLPDDLCIQDRFNACKTPINVFKDHHLQKIWLDIVCPSSTFDINNLKTGQALQQRGLPNKENMNKMEWAE